MAVTGALVFTACSAPEEQEGGYRGEHVVVHTAFGPACEGTLASFDREIARIDAALNLDSGSYVSEVWILDSDEMLDHCPPLAKGCTSGGRIYLHVGYTDSFAHEAVHSRAHPARVNAGKPLFTEGLAEALSRPACFDEDLTFAFADNYFAASHWSELGESHEGYYLGGELLSWLLKNHGPEVILEFMRTIDHDASPTEVREVYSSFFGGSIDDDLFGHLRPLSTKYEPWERGCDLPDAALDSAGHEYVFAEILDCESPRVQNDFWQLSSFDEHERAFVEWSIVVTDANAGYFALSGEMPPTGGVELSPCDCVWANAQHTVGVSPPPLSITRLRPGDEVLLPPNRYRVHWGGTFGDVLDVKLSPPCGVGDVECPAKEQCTIWNQCEPEHDELAMPGASCEVLEGVRTCVSGSRCVNGTCVLECSPNLPCPDGTACGSTRLCGPVCDLVAQDCGDGSSCIPTDASDGTGHCAPAGAGQLMDPCRRLDDVCASGLVCGSCGKGQLDGCCVPLCESNADCPAEVPVCAFASGHSVGVCVGG